MNFSEKLKTFRKEHGLTQKDLAELTGFPRSTITEFETCKRKATLKTLERIASVTHTKISDWITEDINTEDNEFYGLKLVLEALIQAGKIDKNGEMDASSKEKILRLIKVISKNMIK